MGSVYRAKKKESDKEKAIKIIDLNKISKDQQFYVISEIDILDHLRKEASYKIIQILWS